MTASNPLITLVGKKAARHPFWATPRSIWMSLTRVTASRNAENDPRHRI